MAQKTFTRSFAAGEIAPLLFGRLDLDKFQTGLAQCLNMVVQPQGPIENRAGFAYTLACKYWDKASILIPFSFSTQQTFALEFGHQYVRFHTQGGTVLEPTLSLVAVSNANPGLFSTFAPHGYVVGQTVQTGAIAGMASISNRWMIIASTPAINQFTATDLWGQPIDTTTAGAYGGTGKVARVYEVATPYDESQLSTIHYVQSADVLTLVSPYYAPRELRRYANTDWRLETIVFASTLSPPKSTGAVASAINHTYVVVAVAPTQGGYTVPSASATISNDITIPGRYNLLSWNSIPGGINYFIFKLVGAAYQYLGSSNGSTSFVDDNTAVPQAQGFPPAGAFVSPPTLNAAAVLPVGTSLQVTPSAAGATTYTYVVTSTDATGANESMASAPVSTTNDLATAGHFNTVRWPAVPGVALYNVYKQVNGLYGYIGQSDVSCTFIDNFLTPDLSKTPPQQLDPFQGDGNYPQAVSYFEQRRAFAGTLNASQTIWMTRSGTEKNIAYSIPTRDDDAIVAKVVAREANSIRHIVPLGDMLLLTSGAEWLVKTAGSDVLTPSSFSVRPQGYTGASNVQPVVTSKSVLYAQDKGGHVREMQFSWQQQGYDTSDVSILAPHLFDYHTVVQMAYTRSARQCLWTVREDGALLGMTYVPEHEVKAWHQHTTDGLFKSVCSVAEGAEDALYVIVERTINGRTVKYVERQHTRRFDTPADAFFVDCGATYSGTAVQTVTGLHHLEGETVTILADGGVSPPQVVVGGSITIDAPASTIQIGLPYVSRAQTLPLSMQAQAFGQGIVKNINKVQMRVYASQGFEAGPTFGKMRAYPTRITEAYGSPPDLVTDEVPITLDPMWQRNGQLCVQQANPLPFTLLAMTLECETGG